MTFAWRTNDEKIEMLSNKHRLSVTDWYRFWEGWIIQGLDGTMSMAKIDGFQVQTQPPTNVHACYLSS